MTTAKIWTLHCYVWRRKARAMPNKKLFKIYLALTLSSSLSFLVYYRRSVSLDFNHENGQHLLVKFLPFFTLLFCIIDYKEFFEIFNKEGTITDELYLLTLPSTLEEVRLWNEGLRQIVVIGQIVNWLITIRMCST